jgi:hypothetical protein
LTFLLFAMPRSAQAQEQVVVHFGSATRYLTNATDPGPAVEGQWYLPGFDAGGWPVGAYGIGYDMNTPGGAENLILTDVTGPFHSIYTRVLFDVTDASAIYSVTLGQDYDDGVIAWLNGVEIYRSPEMRVRFAVWDEVAGMGESSNGTTPDYTPFRDVTKQALPALVDGTNVFAMAVWNNGTDDLVLAPRLSLNRPLRRGPYLQQGAHDRVTVRWRTGDRLDSKVWYGDAPGNLTSLEIDGATVTEHEVELTGLSANTRYYYAVGSSAGVLAGNDSGHYFDTAPSPGQPKPTRIWVLGDSGEGDRNSEAVRDAYTAWAGGAHTELWLMRGANAYPLGTDFEYQHNLFEIYPEMLRTSVLWPTKGNHDIFDAVEGTFPYLDSFTLPTGGEAGGMSTGTEDYYAFDYGNVHFVVLDSQEGDSTPGSAMMLWLEADLASTTRDWIVALWHHPPYSRGSHNSDDPSDSTGRLEAMRQNVVPLLDDYGVDLVLCGHSHSYERSVLIDGHYGDSTTWDPQTMVVDGGDGDPQSDGAYVKPYRGTVPYAGSGDGAVYAVAGIVTPCSRVPRRLRRIPTSWERRSSRRPRSR